MKVAQVNVLIVNGVWFLCFFFLVLLNSKKKILSIDSLLTLSYYSSNFKKISLLFIGFIDKRRLCEY